MRRMAASLVLCAACIPLTAQEKGPAQKPPEQRRLIYIPLGPGPAKPLAPEPGDEFAVDNTAKQIVIGRMDPGGVLVRYRVPLLTNVDPQITFATELVAGVVRYTYWLTNGPSAKQPIELFAIGTPKPEQIGDLVTPPDFLQGLRSLSSHAKYPRHNWHADYFCDLPPGKSAGPFGFSAPLLPGLVKAYVAARVPSEPVVDENEMKLSLWLSQQLEEAWRFENNTVQPWVIGPKIDLPASGQAQQLIEAIRQEFIDAASLPEFSTERIRLTALAERLSGDSPETLAVEAAIKGAGTTPLQRSFYQAMSIKVAALGRL